MPGSTSRVLLAIAFVLATFPPAPAHASDKLDWHGTPSSIAADCDAQLRALRERTSAIAASRAQRSFGATVLQLENAVADANDALAAQLFLARVAPDEKVEDAAITCQTAFANERAALDADPSLYAAMIRAKRSHTARSVYDRKLTELWFTAMRRSGAALSPPRRTEVLNLTRELNDIHASLEERFDDAPPLIVGRGEVAGIPDDLLASYTRGRGGYNVPVSESTLSFLTYAKNENARRAFWAAYHDRDAAQNTARFERTIAIRDRLAHLLGYETWTDYRLADGVEGTSARVEEFLRSTMTALTPAAQAQLAAMRAAIARDRHDDNATLEPWDVLRAEYLVRRDTASLDLEAVRQYFPLQHTVDAVLDILHTIFGVDFESVRATDAWAPGVLEYEITDSATHALLGTTYFDVFARAHKHGHLESVLILPVRVVNGVRRPAVAAILGNWPQPGEGRPALLSHADVVMLFHELGHDIAAMLATAPYETLSSGFRDGFADAPAQMLENFAWQPEILKRITSDVRTGAPMPDDLITKIVASRGADDAYETARLLTLSLFDIRAHSSGPHVDTTALWQRTAEGPPPLLDAPGAHPIAFDRLTSGYDTGLYARAWAQVYAQDLFTAFAGGLLLDPATWMRYRQDVLAPARTYEPDAEVMRFLGRPERPAAFYAEYGLSCC